MKEYYNPGRVHSFLVSINTEESWVVLEMLVADMLSVPLKKRTAGLSGSFINCGANSFFFVLPPRRLIELWNENRQNMRKRAFKDYRFEMKLVAAYDEEGKVLPSTQMSEKVQTIMSGAILFSQEIHLLAKKSKICWKLFAEAIVRGEEEQFLSNKNLRLLSIALGLGGINEHLTCEIRELEDRAQLYMDTQIAKAKRKAKRKEVK